MAHTIDTKPDKSAFAKAYYAFDNKVHGPCGLTDRERIKELVVVACSMSVRKFSRMVKDPSQLKFLSKSERYHISLIFNHKVTELFKTTTND